MIDTFKLVEDLKSRINPAYANHIGTESHERAQCAEAIVQLQIELMANRRSLSGVFSQLQDAEQEIVELREQLAQERKRLDWALEMSAVFYELDGTHYFAYDVAGYEEFEAIKTTNPRATIDELIAA